MKFARFLAPACLALCGVAAVQALAATKAHAPKAAVKPAVTTRGGASPVRPEVPAVPPAAAQPDTFVSDSLVVARVNDRVITVYDFRDRFYISDAMTRPATDLAGRREFLETLINKEVMGLTAREIDPPFGFEDRLAMRQHVNTVLQNILYARLVLDSVVVDDDAIRAVFPQYGYQQHLRTILLSDRATAEKVRLDLVSGRIRWVDAVKKYSRDPDAGTEGDMGWVSRGRLRGEYGFVAFALQPGSISKVLDMIEGFRIVQCVERRPVKPPPNSFMRTMAVEDLKTAGRQKYVEKMYARVRQAAHVEYDTTNILWAAQQYRLAYEQSGTGANDIGTITPDFLPADTSRVLIRLPKRTVTLGQFMFEFSSIPVMFRQKLVSLEPFIFAIDGPALTEERIELARSLGFENDPEAKQWIEQRREELMVEHIYQDSVVNHVLITPDMRRKFFTDHEKAYVTTAKVRYAQFVRPDSVEAEALRSRLAKGEHAWDIMAADSLRGDDTTGTIQELLANVPNDYRRVLFEELRPGQSTRFGPDKQGHYLVLQLIAYEPSRPMTYREAQAFVDDALQNMESERLLKDFLARHRTRYHIESHPELLARIRMSDPKHDLALAPGS